MSEQSFLLRCNVHDGMFPDELAVELEGKNISLFAPKEAVIEKDGQKYLIVRLLEEKDQDSHIYLPSEALEIGSRWLSVPSKTLIAR
jgi:hypothetical protein